MCAVCVHAVYIGLRTVGGVSSVFPLWVLEMEAQVVRLVAETFPAESSHWPPKCFNCLILQCVHSIDVLSFVLIVAYVRLSCVISTVIICKVT